MNADFLIDFTSFTRDEPANMASLQKGKKVVNQDDLRRLMREKKQASERQKRVESPYAKYSSTGALSCTLCNAPIKSALLWQTHVLGKQHKDRVNELKSGDGGKSSASPVPSTAPVLKRAAPETVGLPGKRAKTHNTAVEQKSSTAALGLLAGHYDEDEEEDDSKDEAAAPPAPANTLPADFFDSGMSSMPPAVSHSGSVTKADEPADEPKPEESGDKKEKSAEALPEGFFDDPVRDAKVRNVDTPKDQLDREWEEFQKEMRQVNNASDAIVAEDDEEGRLERQIDEIDEQMECLRRVEELRARQERVRSADRRRRQEEQSQEEEEEESEEEEQLMHVLMQDWRAKGALT